VVYSGDDATGAELARRAEERFGVKLERPIGVVRLKWRALVVPERYPFLTMVGQALGSALLVGGEPPAVHYVPRDAPWLDARGPVLPALRRGAAPDIASVFVT
jgi:hypothetical protein